MTSLRTIAALGFATLALTTRDAVAQSSCGCASDEFAFLTAGSAFFNNEVLIQGNVGVNDPGGRARLGRGAAITGTLSADAIALGQRSLVTDARTNSLHQSPDAVVEGTIASVTLPLIDPFCTLPAITCGSDAVTVGRNALRTLTPGTYGPIFVASDGRVRLDGNGTFVFCSLTLGRGAAIEATGDATIAVEGEVRLGAGASITTDSGVPLTLLVAGPTVRLSQSALIEAAVTAPNATVKLQRGAELRGCFCAGRATTDKRVSLTCLSEGEMEAAGQARGSHASVTTSDGSIRDDAFADFVCAKINENGGQVKDVKLFTNACYGGGLLDDFQRVFGPGGACAGVKWIGGSASAAHESAIGASQRDVDSRAAARFGSWWTTSLAGPTRRNLREQHPGSILDRASDRVLDDLRAARDDDEMGPSHRREEHPVIATGNGGEGIGWADAGTKHQAVVFGGLNNAQRHHNNITNMTEALEAVWTGSPHDVQPLDGATTQQLKDAIATAAAALDANTELVLYLDDHGDTETDLLERLGIAQLAVTSLRQISFPLHSGWRDGLRAMARQSGIGPQPRLGIDLANVITGSDWRIILNGTELPLPPGSVTGALLLPVDWQTLETGANALDIVPLGSPMGSMVLDQLELTSGPITETERP